MNATLTALRNEYRALQAASGLDRETFRRATLGLAHELADGCDQTEVEEARTIVAAARETSETARAGRRVAHA